MVKSNNAMELESKITKEYIINQVHNPYPLG